MCVAECPEYTYKYDSRCFSNGCPAHMGAIPSTANKYICEKIKGENNYSDGNTELAICSGYTFEKACYNECPHGLKTVDKTCVTPDKQDDCTDALGTLVQAVYNKMSDKNLGTHNWYYDQCSVKILAGGFYIYNGENIVQYGYKYNKSSELGYFIKDSRLYSMTDDGAVSLIDQ